MMDYQTKTREAKLKAAKKKAEQKKEPIKIDLTELYGFLNELTSKIAGIEDNNSEIFNKLTEQQKQNTVDLNNNIVKVMEQLLKNGVKITTDEFRVKNLKDIKIPKTIIPKEVSIKNLDWIASDSSIKDLSEKLANIADQLATPPSPPGQTPEDYVPFRRVYASGGKLTFDDSSWGGARGGGIDTTNLATSTKQDDIISAITAGSNTYGIQAISDDGTYKYYFFEDNDANYYILRKTIATKLFKYTAGTGGYAAVYVDSTHGPSGSPTWGDRGSTF